MANGDPFKVCIAGGGVAALEAALALRDLAGEHVAIQLVAPGADFRYRPLTVREPFAFSRPKQYELSTLAGDIGVELVVDAFAWVDAPKQVAHTDAGAELPYDALLLAIGARTHPALTHALTIDDSRMDELLQGVVQDVEGGYARRIAFVVPSALAWPLPIYELALMTAHRAYDMNMSVELTVVTPEAAPLEVFGTEVSQTVAGLLEAASISTITSASAQTPQAGRLRILPQDDTLEVDRVIALPELSGPAVRGLPAGEHGFIPVDAHGQVRGVARVYAAGDATDYPVKHGGLAAQQADAAARSIAALAGAQVTPQPLEPEIHGILLTGAKPKYLTARITGGRGFSSQIGDEPTWSPPSKISAHYLSPYLAERS